MPPKRRHYKKKNKADTPVVFGPPPPPPHAVATTPLHPPPVDSTALPTPPTASVDPPDIGEKPEAVRATIGRSGGQGRRKKLPRKKFKDATGGWGDGEELPAHAEDVGRYDPDDSWDLRLLRACDEFRSLRSFRDKDVRVNYQTLLRWLRADIVQLRQTYGSQPLRGYGPELDRDEEGSDEEGGDEEDDPLQEAKLSFTGKSEEEWASIVFDPGRFAKFFDNRFNEGYTPTLTIAPRTAASLLKFFLTRQVFPKQTLRIKVCLKVCEIASKQLLPASIARKQLPNYSSLSFAVNRLFPNLDSTLSLPFDPSSVNEASFTYSGDSVPQDKLIDVEAATEVVEPATKEGETSAKVDGEGARHHGKGKMKETQQPTSEYTGKDGGTWPKQEGESDSPFVRLTKQVETEASLRRQWSSSSAPSLLASVDTVISIARRLRLFPTDENGGEEKVVEGVWRVGSRELSARTLIGWKVLAETTTEMKAKQPMSEKEQAGGGKEEQGTERVEERFLVQLQLSGHEEAFPLTSKLEQNVLETGKDDIDHRNLSSPINLVVDLPSSFTLSHLDTLTSALFEASLNQLVFLPSSSTSSPPFLSTFSSPTSVFFLSHIHRIIPSYWTTQQELLRDEPRPQTAVVWEEGEDALTVEKMKEKWEREERELEAAVEESKAQEGNGEVREPTSLVVSAGKEENE